MTVALIRITRKNDHLRSFTLFLIFFFGIYFNYKCDILLKYFYIWYLYIILYYNIIIIIIIIIIIPFLNSHGFIYLFIYFYLLTFYLFIFYLFIFYLFIYLFLFTFYLFIYLFIFLFISINNILFYFILF